MCVGEQTHIRKDGISILSRHNSKRASLVLQRNRSKILSLHTSLWAIGKGATREATKEEADEMAIYIKRLLVRCMTPQQLRWSVLYMADL